ncbi:HD-like signal output (HDOD) domain, no enzymatic activity [Desulfatibacillum alkenivorans DSM 16219]|jgi:HD-like signal output (HDOD) protein|uniref:HD-like signal output (HDOD) domain, no enzymatic activity n=1 Tax=Desulfatibacillum alkenivorans DSM 16219 TaxID=1121393 RepID=A0A1M6E7J3_9BACT|nr:HDOD domain-containing protein [Desulfatibacillum alkenivorans]SHI81349.1 HD-like signal output (HDOD) domain, no enzymatic activity [Desulfatibacillum alkenivorans DSM 16219]
MQIEGNFSKPGSLPHLIDTLSQTKRTGVLRFSDNAQTVIIFFKDGQAVYASGPKSQARLGLLLRKRGLISEDNLRMAVTHARQKKVILGQALVDKHLIEPKDLHTEIKALTDRTMEELLHWRSGSFAYEDAPVSLESFYPARQAVDANRMKKRIANSVRVLPPMPSVIQKAQKVMADPSSNLRQLGEILEKDQGIAARILRLVNSPYYGLACKVASIDRAIVVLGRKTLSEIISMASMSVFANRDYMGYGFTGEEMWWHTIAVGMGAKIIAEKVCPKLAEDAFAAGLIHDAGKLVLDKFVLEEKAEFDRMIANKQLSYEAEKELLGWNHAEIASQICSSWKVPDHMTEAVMHHHKPGNTKHKTLASIVHLADAMAHVCAADLGMPANPYKIDRNAVQLLGLETLEMNHIMNNIQEAVEKARETIQA